MLYDDYEYPYEGWERWERSKSLNSIKSISTTNSVTSGNNHNNNTTINRSGSTSSDTLAAIHIDSSSPILKRFQRSHSVTGNPRTSTASPTANGGEYRMNRKGVSLKKLKKWYSGTQGSDTKGTGWSPRLTRRNLKKSQSMPDTTVHLVFSFGID